jgi:hypothetical protein
VQRILFYKSKKLCAQGAKSGAHCAESPVGRLSFIHSLCRAPQLIFQSQTAEKMLDRGYPICIRQAAKILATVFLNVKIKALILFGAVHNIFFYLQIGSAHVAFNLLATVATGQRSSFSRRPPRRAHARETPEIA